MTQRILDIYLKILSETGQKNAHDLMGIDPLDFEVLSEAYSDEEIISAVRNSKYGLYLFRDNGDFTQRVLTLLSPFIIKQIEIYSDLLKNQIVIHSLSIDNQSFVLLVQVRMSAILNFL